MHVLFEDHHLIAVNKPAGLMTQAPAGVPSLEAEVKAYIKEKYAKPAGVYLGIPHRLDRPVSGVIVFCRNTKAAQRVAEQFQKHQVTKVYWALVKGRSPRTRASGGTSSARSATRPGRRSSRPTPRARRRRSRCTAC